MHQALDDRPCIPVSSSSMSMAMTMPQTMMPDVKLINLGRLISAPLTHVATGLLGASSSSSFSSLSDRSSSFVGRAWWVGADHPVVR